jgi:membrane-bound lytic murein transglycosylase D
MAAAGTTLRSTLLPLIAGALLASACVPATPVVTPVVVEPAVRQAGAPARPDAPPAAPSAGVAVQQGYPVGPPMPVPDRAPPPPASPPRRDPPDTTLDIVGGATALFGEAPPAPAAADVAPSWDIDVRSYETRAEVVKYIGMFSGEARERIAERFSRGTRYEAMIRRQLRDGGLPEDMYYLAMIESGFDPNAYSRAAAVGMWQFMTATAKGVGLRVDWWIDERRDPVRSTTAAVAFLKGLNEQFGSMYLAAAAYNGGPGRISRGLTRYSDDLAGTAGDDIFFALAEKPYLKVETRNYVPQLIATALIGKEPARYGMTIVEQPPFTFDSVRVGPAVPLAVIARAAGTTVDALRELNPQLLRGMTPPRDSALIRLPEGTVDAFRTVFADLPDSARLAGKAVTSKTGESMASIAKRAKITTAQLNAVNPGMRRLKSGNLVVGQRVFVPNAETIAGMTTAPDPAIERYGSVVVGAGSHLVVRGDNLGSIAKRYGTTVKALMAANRMKRDVIFAGQTLVIPKR